MNIRYNEFMNNTTIKLKHKLYLYKIIYIIRYTDIMYNYFKKIDTYLIDKNAELILSEKVNLRGAIGFRMLILENNKNVLKKKILYFKIKKYLFPFIDVFYNERFEKFIKKIEGEIICLLKNEIKKLKHIKNKDLIEEIYEQRKMQECINQILKQKC